MTRYFGLCLILAFAWPVFGQVDDINCPVPPDIARDPFTSISRTTPWPMDLTTLGQIINGKYLGPISGLKGITVQQNARLWPADQALRAYLKDTKPVDNRALVIRENLRAFLSSRNPRVMKFAYVGQAHAIDLYLAHPELRVGYWHKPFNLKTLSQSSDLRRLNEILRIETPPLFMDDDSLQYLSLPYSFALKSSMQLKFKMAFTTDLPPRPKKFPRATVMNELHEIVSNTWTDQMPSADCLKAAGVEKVLVGLESYAKGHHPTFNEVFNRLNLLEQIQFQARLAGQKTEDVVARLFPTDLAQKILSGQVDENPGMTSFIRKLKAYQESGLVVKFYGIESSDYSEGK